MVVPPIKIQGIKTKLIPFLKEHIHLPEGRWIEPFLGSGSVVFNFQPERAILSDVNPHIIRVYRDIQKKRITPERLRKYLEREGSLLEQKGEDHYYFIRERFNRLHNPYDFLFLNRSCFNGLMRFNQQGKFNVPFCRKPERFQKALITKICNQVKQISEIIEDKDWTFVCQDWTKTLRLARQNDFIYFDPPYYGRNADYFNQWTESDADYLVNTIQTLNCQWGYSMWLENQHRKNSQIENHFLDYPIKTFDHFYHIGSSENLRSSMKEALILSKDYLSMANFSDRKNKTNNIIPLFV